MKLTLHDDEAALIIRAVDGPRKTRYETKVYVPNVGRNDPTPPQAMLIGALATRLADKRWVARLLTWFIFQTMAKGHDKSGRVRRATPR